MNQTWPATPFAHLSPERDYLVVQTFRDFDGGLHEPGESWTFIGSSFLPYDDGLSLFAVIDGQRRQVRMQWRDEQQGPIIDNLKDYLQPKK